VDRRCAQPRSAGGFVGSEGPYPGDGRFGLTARRRSVESCTMHDQPTAVAARPRIERKVVQDQVYDLLKERVLDRTFRPGERLNVDALARELAVSSTPIRESLARLVAEGLARAEPFVGFFVADMPSRAYYEQLYEYRLVVEPWAAAETARRRPSAVVAALEDSVGAMKRGTLSKRYARYRGFAEADAAFHAAVVAGAGNEPAARAYEYLRIHLHLSRLYIDRDQDTDETYGQHAAILDAIRAGRQREAATTMRVHLRASKERLLAEPQ
jgi:DNA-binding GntR family transcriptional regulator